MSQRIVQQTVYHKQSNLFTSFFAYRTRFAGVVQGNDEELRRREGDEPDDELEERNGFLRPDPSLQTGFNVRKTRTVAVTFAKNSPNSSDFNSLSPHNVKENCKKAFDAGDQLGIPRVIEPSDMDMLAGNKTVFSCNKSVLND